MNLLDLSLRKLLHKLSLSDLPVDRYKVSRYAELTSVCRARDPATILEIGVWRGDRSVKMLRASPRCRKYVGFDLFEDMDDATFEGEHMGSCFPAQLDVVKSRLLKARPDVDVQLIKGNTMETLPEFVENTGTPHFDFIYLDGGHSLETVASDWQAVEQLMDDNSVVAFDDYYLNDDTRGCKKLIDGLNSDRFKKHFFSCIEQIPPELAESLDPLFITMVAVARRNAKPA